MKEMIEVIILLLWGIIFSYYLFVQTPKSKGSINSFDTFILFLTNSSSQLSHNTFWSSSSNLVLKPQKYSYCKSNQIEYESAKEVYANGIGLIYKENIILNIISGNISDVNYGTSYVQELINY